MHAKNRDNALLRNQKGHVKKKRWVGAKFLMDRGGEKRKLFCKIS